MNDTVVRRRTVTASNHLSDNYRFCRCLNLVYTQIEACYDRHNGSQMTDWEVNVLVSDLDLIPV